MVRLLRDDLDESERIELIRERNRLMDIEDEHWLDASREESEHDPEN
jgi:hypothetical protein